MKDILLIYGVIQLVSTAYGLSVIGSVKPLIEKRLRDQGYVEKNKNSLYKFNEDLGNFFKGLIPFYYAVKAVSLVRGRDPIERAVREEISSRGYITREEQTALLAQEQMPKEQTKVKMNIEPEIAFEKPERYTARKNDISLYNTYETPVEYMTRESSLDEKFEPTPFVTEHPVTPTFIKEEVTKSDIAKALAELDAYELDALELKLKNLAEIKRNSKRLMLEKDVA
jgi:CBS domain-containing protein